MITRSLLVMSLALFAHSSFAVLPDDDKLKVAREHLLNKASRNLVNTGGMCLDVSGDVNRAGTHVKTFNCNKAVNQKWKLKSGRLVNKAGKCLDVAGDVNRGGTIVQIWDCNNAPNQKWRLEKQRLVNGGGKCLDVSGDIKKSGNKVQIWDCNNAPNQKWSFR